MKYEFKATARIFLPAYSAMLIMAVVSHLLSGRQMNVPHIISIALVSMLIAAAFVITLILTIQRFYKNLLTDEGYLMFTLPVSTGRLIWSKLIVAAVWSIVCAVSVFAAVAIMAMNAGDFQSFMYALTHLGIRTFSEALLLAEFFLIVLTGLLCGILCIYACMALSLLFNKHRVAIAFAIYIGMTTALQILAAIVAALTKNSSGLGVLFGFTAYPAPTSESGFITFLHNNAEFAVHLSAWLFLLGIAALGAGFFAITRHMLKNRLNLQ
jgi:hypothetical protein